MWENGMSRIKKYRTLFCEKWERATKSCWQDQKNQQKIKLKVKWLQQQNRKRENRQIKNYETAWVVWKRYRQ